MDKIDGRRGPSAAAKGKAVKITRGLYLQSMPSPVELAQIISEHWPDCALDGYSAAQVHLEKPLQLPLQLIRQKGLADTQFFTCRRARPKGVFQSNRISACNPLQAVEVMTEEDAVSYLEELLSGSDAEQRLRLFMMDFPRLPVRTQGILSASVIGADSEVERALTRALEPFFAVRNNVKIGPYKWDLFIEKHLIAIEVDGYEYHNGEKRQRFESDRHKLNDAVHRGLKPLHYTATTILHHLDFVVQQVRNVAAGNKDYAQPPWTWHYLYRGEWPW